MTTAIVYASKTGNTAALAHALKSLFPPTDVLYCGAPGPDARAAAAGADVVLAGFWTDKGSCSPELSDFLAGLSGKTVFFFGTAGFGGDPAYYDKIMGNVRQSLPPTCREAGWFMCQGAMPQAIAARWRTALAANPEDSAARASLANFEAGQGHPDQTDTDALKRAVSSALALC